MIGTKNVNDRELHTAPAYRMVVYMYKEFKFDVEKFSYKLTFDHGEWRLALINKYIGNRKVVDSLFFDYFDESDEYYDDLSINANPFLLSKASSTIISNFVFNNKKRINLFYFSCLSDRRLKPYAKFSKRLCRMLNDKFIFQRAGHLFYFSKA